MSGGRGVNVNTGQGGQHGIHGKAMMAETSSTIAAEAYAFRQLVAHLQQRKDVQNIELMILSGFCRNCAPRSRTDQSCSSSFFPFPCACSHGGISLSRRHSTTHQT